MQTATGGILIGLTSWLFSIAFGRVAAWPVCPVYPVYPASPLALPVHWLKHVHNRMYC
jgi:hypothetical protein